MERIQNEMLAPSVCRLFCLMELIQWKLLLWVQMQAQVAEHVVLLEWGKYMQ
jgi:hypothetical protein